ncbi:alpha/beta hydrolase [Sphingomonas ginsenosidivorax]|uniref:Alpha/beta hydrolase n=2 Tax=Sphingomonas ginsenosidivorax TaxID=862135 RepID=A0A5C6UNM6_9SPHN|nr:alpha/beta hydrolase [Sphingomonas ginsenosidivorax]
MAANPRPALTADVLAAIRGMTITPEMTGDLPVGDLGEIRDVTMPGPGGDIALRLFDPRSDRTAGPVVIFYHGGGYAVGSIGSHAGLAAEIARQLDLPVVSVEYRLAPENPWPAAPDDGEAAARWIAQNGAAFGRDFTGLVLCGDSAGGNLAIVTALALRDAPAALPVLLQLAIYPAVDHSREYPSRRAFAEGYGLDSKDTTLFDQHYAADKRHPRNSPLLVDQTGMPPTLVVTASLDPLRDEGRAYAAATTLAGVPTVFHEAVGTIHGFACYRRAIPSAQADLAACLGLARAMLNAR